VAPVSDAPTSRFQRAERQLSDRFARRQLASVGIRVESASRPSYAARLLVWLAVAPVHLMLLGSAVAGTWLLVRGHGWPLKVLGVVLLLVAYATFPRPAATPRHSASLLPADAPALFGLLADIGGQIGAKPPARVLVDRDFNAAATRVGWRRTPMLVIGAPLWVAAPPQARVALLGHELGHFAHHDLTHGWWVWTAQRSLQHWAEMLGGPRHVMYSRNALAFRLVAILQLVPLGYLWLIGKLRGPARQRAEYLADVDAARVGSTSGAVRMLEVLLLEPAVSTAMTRAAVSPTRPDMWGLVMSDVSGLGDDDFRRRRQGLDAERSRIDDSHPATVLRLRLLEQLPVMSAGVVMDASRRLAVDADLEGPLQVAAGHAAERIRYRR